MHLSAGGNTMYGMKGRAAFAGWRRETRYII